MKTKLTTIAFYPAMQGVQGEHQQEERAQAYRDTEKMLAEFELNRQGVSRLSSLLQDAGTKNIQVQEKLNQRNQDVLKCKKELEL